MGVFDKFGHPGKFKEVVVLNNETGSFTGSHATGAGNDHGHGAGGIIVGESGATGEVHLTHGGVVNLAHLAHEVQYDLSVSEVRVNAKAVYVLKTSGAD